MSKPKVFFDITADGKSLGRIVMEVSRLVAFSQPAVVGKNTFFEFHWYDFSADHFCYIVTFFFFFTAPRRCRTKNCW